METNRTSTRIYLLNKDDFVMTQNYKINGIRGTIKIIFGTKMSTDTKLSTVHASVGMFEVGKPCVKSIFSYCIIYINSHDFFRHLH
jgi:hypothetical protein